MARCTGAGGTGGSPEARAPVVSRGGVPVKFTKSKGQREESQFRDPAADKDFRGGFGVQKRLIIGPF